MEQIPSLEANRFAASQEIPPNFMEPEGSLPYSQVPATCLYPESAQIHFCCGEKKLTWANVYVRARAWIRATASGHLHT
jgi:hypothetical protein